MSSPEVHPSSFIQKTVGCSSRIVKMHFNSDRPMGSLWVGEIPCFRISYGTESTAKGHGLCDIDSF